VTYRPVAHRYQPVKQLLDSTWALLALSPFLSVFVAYLVHRGMCCKFFST